MTGIIENGATFGPWGALRYTLRPSFHARAGRGEMTFRPAKPPPVGHGEGCILMTNQPEGFASRSPEPEPLHQAGVSFPRGPGKRRGGRDDLITEGVNV